MNRMLITIEFIDECRKYAKKFIDHVVRLRKDEAIGVYVVEREKTTTEKALNITSQDIKLLDTKKTVS